MWPSRLFWKLCAVYAVLILVSTAVLASVIAARQQAYFETYLKERLRDKAELLRLRMTVATPVNATDLQGIVQHVARETGVRVTVIAHDGKVIADSNEDPRQMDNQKNQPEIEQALRDGVGILSHTDHGQGIPTVFVALRVGPADRSDQAFQFIRVTQPSADLNNRVADTRRLVWGIGTAVLLGAVGLNFLFVIGLTRPLRAIARAAQAITSGDYGHRVHLTSRDEIGELGTTFNRMSDELSQRVAQVRDERELLATVLGGMVEGVIALDASQRILFANNAAQIMLGLQSANLADRPLWELVRHPAVQEAVQNAFTSEAPCRLEFELPGANRLSLILFARQLRGSPPAGAVLVLHDVTELRRLEGLRRDFVANVSHELKTPLSSIKAYAETLIAGAIHDREFNLSFVRQIEEQADRLHDLILDLLSLARIEAGQETFEIESLPVEKAVDSSVSEYLPAATNKKIRLETQPSDEPLRVLADAEGLREILNNLIDNAIKYTAEGGCVTIRWSAEDGMARIELEDTGIGISPRDQARIFERFYRVDKHRSRELGGTGLGLSIVKHLTHAFGGTVAVRSELGRGSLFVVRLPRPPQ